MSTRRLARFPASGRVVPEFEDVSLQELIIFKYRILYQTQDDEVRILTVAHGARSLDRELSP